MNIAFHTGKTALIAQAQALSVYGNNLANINTYGYQTQRPITVRLQRWWAYSSLKIPTG